MLEVRFPKNSTDLYENAKEWKARYGSDFLFVTGTLSRDPVAPENENFSFLEDCDFTLCEKVAINPDIPDTGLTPEQKERRQAFLARRINEGLQNKFPTIADVRKQEAGGKGVYLLSNGMEIFVARPQDDGPAYLLALFQRTHSVAYGLLTGPNGLASGPNSVQTETIEELTLVNVASRTELIVYALVFDNGIENPGHSLSIKQAQEKIIKKNLEAKSYKAPLEFEPLKVVKLKPHELGLNDNCLVLREKGTNRRLDILCGSLGFEHDHYTLIHREFGGVIPPPGADILIIDGEPFNRPGNLFDAFSLEAVREKGKALSSLLGIIPQLCVNWPRPLASHVHRVRLPYGPKR